MFVCLSLENIIIDQITLFWEHSLFFSSVPLQTDSVLLSGSLWPLGNIVTASWSHHAGTEQNTKAERQKRCPPSLSDDRRHLHVLLHTVSVLLFGIINPLPLLKHTNHRESKEHGESGLRSDGESKSDPSVMKVRRLRLQTPLQLCVCECVVTFVLCEVLQHSLSHTHLFRLCSSVDFPESSAALCTRFTFVFPWLSTDIMNWLTIKPGSVWNAQIRKIYCLNVCSISSIIYEFIMSNWNNAELQGQKWLVVLWKAVSACRGLWVIV